MVLNIQYVVKNFINNVEKLICFTIRNCVISIILKEVFHSTEC